MNIERLTEIAEWLEAGGDDGARRFIMQRWLRRDSCGTFCCIGGYTVDKWGENGEYADSLLGLTLEHANMLFFGENENYRMLVDWSSVTAEHAARVVRHLIKTGEVDWTV